MKCSSCGVTLEYDDGAFCKKCVLVVRPGLEAAIRYQEPAPVVAVLHARDGSLAEGPWPVVGRAESWAQAVELIRDHLGCQDVWVVDRQRGPVPDVSDDCWRVGCWEAEAI